MSGLKPHRVASPTVWLIKSIRRLRTSGLQTYPDRSFTRSLHFCDWPATPGLFGQRTARGKAARPDRSKVATAPKRRMSQTRSEPHEDPRLPSGTEAARITTRTTKSATGLKGYNRSLRATLKKIQRTTTAADQRPRQARFDLAEWVLRNPARRVEDGSSTCRGPCRRGPRPRGRPGRHARPGKRRPRDLISVESRSASRRTQETRTTRRVPRVPNTKGRSMAWKAPRCQSPPRAAQANWAQLCRGLLPQALTRQYAGRGGRMAPSV